MGQWAFWVCQLVLRIDCGKINGGRFGGTADFFGVAAGTEWQQATLEWQLALSVGQGAF
ncbi:hypothetical protein [Peribacillus deserti]|uniref:hypothetical protein n=1 Tax=Peribacillus deserti TaxID=673318 RepID=UPI0015E092F5|nr:hypothetical protein [Peribacillus deserti]